MKGKYCLLIIFLLSALLISCSKSEQKPPSWLPGMVEYSAHEYMPPGKFKWDWSAATLIKGLVMYNESYPELVGDSLMNYFQDCLKKTKSVESGIHPNVVSMGHLLAYMARRTKDGSYSKRAHAIYDQYLDVVRAENGGISHRDNTIELWDDTVYMIGLYLFEMYKLTGEIKYLDEFVLQLKAHHEKLMDEENGLWVHAWDADTIYHYDRCGMENWPDKDTQRNHEHWGRGNGWVTMACVDALELMEPGTKEYEVVKTIFNQLMERLSELQDDATGHWYQLPIYPGEKGNWIESSCTAMFTYSIMKGIKLGVLKSDKYGSIANKALEGLIKHSVKKIEDQWYTPINVCTGTCPGDKNYYYGREKVEGKPFALGIFIMMGTIMDTL